MLRFRKRATPCQDEIVRLLFSPCGCRVNVIVCRTNAITDTRPYACIKSIPGVPPEAVYVRG